MSVDVGTGDSPRGRIDWLDGVRAYAIAAVVLVHSSQIVSGLSGVSKEVGEAGQYGVQLFFCISAATVMLTYSKHLQTGEPARYWLIRRFLRIAPLYYAAIVFYWLWAIAKSRLGGGGPASAVEVLANIAFVHGFVPSANNNVVPGGWSIGVEMVFYALTPLIYWVREARRWFILVGIAVVLSAISVLCNGGFGPSDYWYFSPLNQLPVLFLASAAFNLAAPWLTTVAPTPQAWRIGSWLALPLGLGITVWLGTWGQVAPLVSCLPMAIAGVAFMVLARCDLAVMVRGRIARLVAQRSFSIYIVHFAVLNVLEFADGRMHWTGMAPAPIALAIVFATTLILSTIVSELTYRFIETPGNALAKRLTIYRNARPIVTSQSIPACKYTVHSRCSGADKIRQKTVARMILRVSPRPGRTP